MNEKNTKTNTLVRDKDVADANVRVASVPTDVNRSRKDGSVEIGQYISQDERTVLERYLCLTVDMGKILKLGETLPLLFLLIRKCGAGDCCVLNYATLAEACQVSVSTIKVWSNKLEEFGFIHKQISGSNGMTFTLNDAGIGRSDLFKRIDRRLSQSAEQVKATMVIAQNAFERALASLLFKTNAE